MWKVRFRKTPEYILFAWIGSNSNLLENWKKRSYSALKATLSRAVLKYWIFPIELLRFCLMSQFWWIFFFSFELSYPESGCRNSSMYVISASLCSSYHPYIIVLISSFASGYFDDFLIWPRFWPAYKNLSKLK